MSIKIVTVNPRSGVTVEDEGVFCYCRRKNVKGIKTGNGFSGPSSREKLTIDLGPSLKTENFSPDNRFSVFINCGAVPVETKEYWDIVVINSEIPNQHYKTLVIEKQEENPVKEQFGSVFRILPSKQNDLTLPTINNCNSRLSKRPSDKKLTFRLVFQPELPCIVYNRVFNIWVDNIPIRLKVRGFSQGPSVCLSQNILNFGAIFLGDEMTLNIEIHNHSQTTTQFQFDNDNMRGVFQICPLTGTIEPMEIVHLDVTFKPTMPTCFYRRVYCLVHHQDPQFIDLIGVSIPKPKIIYGPILIGVNTSNAELIPWPSEENNEFFENNHFWGINISCNSINFGLRDLTSNDTEEGIEPVTINFTSNLPYDTKVQWSPDATNVFSVEPSTQILPKMKSISFEIRFHPSFPDSFYDGNMECFIYPTNENWSEEGPPWKCFLKLDEKKSTQWAEIQGNEEYSEFAHGDPDLLMAKRSVAIKESTHGHRENTYTRQSLSKIHSIAIVTTNDKSHGSSMLPSEVVDPSTTLSPLIPNLSTSYDDSKSHSQKGENKFSVGKESIRGSHAHFYHHQHVVHDHKPDGFEGSENANLIFYEHGGFEMEVCLTRLKSEEPVIFSIDPVGEVTHTIPKPVEEQLNDEKKPSVAQVSNDTSKSKFEVKPKNSPMKKHMNSNVNPSVLRKYGKENLRASLEKHDKLSEGDSSLQVDDSTLMPSVSTLSGRDGVGDGPERFGLPEVLGLPLCITIKVSGHTYPPSSYASIPDIKLQSKALMYSTLPMNPVCRSILIRNNNDLPSFFNLASIEGDDAYAIKPKQGLIPGKCHQVVLALLNPSNPFTKMYTANCKFTFNLQDNCQVGLYGYGEAPTLGIRVLYESSAKGHEIVCLPTIPGCSSNTFIELENTSGFHYRFWLEPADWSGDIWKAITPEPRRGYIAPFEKVPISWKFAPTEELTYYIYWRFCFDVIQARTDSKTSYTDYEFIFPLTGAGKAGHLHAEPSFLDFELVPIFEPKTKWFNVMNLGACPISVDLMVFHEQWLEDFAPELVTINPKTVDLVPHQAVSISVTVRPSRANIQNFYVIYHINGQENQEQNSNSRRRVGDLSQKHLVDITFIGDHAIVQAIDIMLISRHPMWDAQQCWLMFSMDKFNQCLIPYSHTAIEGNIPEVPSVAFRFPPAPVESDTSIFQILLSNSSDLKGYWEIFTAPPKNWKKFLNKKLSSKLVFYDGHFKDNPDLLATLWAEKFGYGEGNLPDNVCTLDDQTTKEGYKACLDLMAENKSNNNSLNPRKDAEMFEIYPLSGSLNNSGTQLITVKYKFGRVGYHKMSILLRIYPAIFVWIDLTGRTLEINKPYLQLMHKSLMHLHPICPADMDPPVQMFWVYNGGNAVANFTVDMDPFELLKDKHFGHAVIECLTETGSVHPRSWFPIKLRFSPLEFTDYSVPLRILPEFSETPLEIMLTGNTAFNTTVCLRPMARGGEFRSFIIYDHEIPISLSPAHISITHLIPTGHKVTSCVFLTNLHTQNYMNFKWSEIAIEGGGSIKFQPDSGRISPREQISCLVIIQAGKVAASFSSMIRCMIEDENEKIIHEFVLNQWKKENEEIKLMDSENPGRYAHSDCEKFPKPVSPKPFSLLLAVSIYIGSVFGLYDSILPKERSRMPHPEPIEIDRPLPANIDGGTGTILSNFERKLSNEVISEILWDIVQGSSFESFVRQATKRQAPFYEEYKECEKERENNRNSLDQEAPKLPRQPIEEILEAAVFNIIQEMSANYTDPETRDNWDQLPPVQPQAFVDVNKYKKYM